ncbi:uncharacterized protein LOC114429697 [Parambassis ranga]|uniref:Uncharacterized protein LOC114429697 n=1 Tax=Parambassis ranga TaxID=210632 RepID=A0A6P7HQA2_9TELE|nr:uncharacterized protein LOC114429697 [Parambassis ranga]
MAMRYAPAQHNIQHNRLMYTLVKLLWLRSHGSLASPVKNEILKAYERIQHRVLLEDAVLSKAGIPLAKINIKTVRDFIRRQERLLNLHSTQQPQTITKTTSISSVQLPPAPHQPAVLPPPDYPLKENEYTPSLAGTKVLKGRADIFTPVSHPEPPLQLVPAPRKKVPVTSTITRPSSVSASDNAGPPVQLSKPASQKDPPPAPKTASAEGAGQELGKGDSVQVEAEGRPLRHGSKSITDTKSPCL